MSKKACGDLRKQLPIQRNLDWYERRMVEDHYAQNYGDNRKSPWYAKLTTFLSDKYGSLVGKESIASVDSQRRYLNKRYKKREAERVLLMSQIEALLESNPGVSKHFWKFVQSEMTLLDPELMRRRFPEYEIKTFKNEAGQMVPHLDTLPPDFLRPIYAELYGWVNDGKFWKKKTSRLRTIQLEMLTPDSVVRKDSTGLIGDMNSSLSTWTNNAAARASDFYQGSMDGKRPGLYDISNKIKELYDSFGNVPIDEVWDIFFRFKRGQAFFKKGDNRLWMSTKWVQPKPGEPHRWIRSEDAITPYVWKDEQHNEFTVEFTQDKVGSLGQTQLELLVEANKMLVKWYDSVFETAEAITEAHNKRRRKINEIADKNGTHDLLEEITEFGMLADNVDIQGLSKVDKKNKYHFTRMYYQDQIPRLLEEALMGEHGMINKRDMLASKLREWDPSVEHTQAEVDKQLQYEERLNSLNADIHILNEKVEKFNDGLFDTQFNEYIQAQHVLKNFKHVTEMIHPDNARTDSNVLVDYIDGLFRTSVRNDVTLDLMEAVASKGHLARPGVVDYAIDHYKSSFYFPDAKTTYLGFKTDAKTWANRISALGYPITAEELSTQLRTLSSFFIFNTLNGPLQGMTNYSAFMLKIHEQGVDKVTRYLDEFDRNPEYWRNLAAKSGVTKFTNFIEGYVQKGLRPDEIVVYKEEMKKLLDEIELLDETGNEKRLLRLKKRWKKLKNKEWGDRMSRAAQWAITRKIYYYQHDSRLKKAIKASAGNFYGKVLPSIAETEEELRTMSFLIGVQNFLERNRGMKADSPEAIAAGVDYTQRTDFGLSHQHVGLAFRGPLGGFLTRMRIWHVQRFGNDINVYKRAFRENTRPEMLDRTEDGEYVFNSGWMKRAARSGSGLVKTFGSLVMPPGPLATKQRLDRKYSARARSHFWTHAVMTGIMDFGLYALAPPGTGTMMSYVARGAGIAYYRSPMGKGLAGFGSSLMSLTFGAAHLLGIMATGGFEDKEYTPEQFFMKYAYHIPILGLGASVMIDLALHASHNHRLDRARGKHSHQQDHLKKIRNVASPGGRVPWEFKEFIEFVFGIRKDPEWLESDYVR